jgi:succinyl-CoA synthetase beta subunit
MMLLEHDAKRLLEDMGARIPAGLLVRDAARVSPLPCASPWIVKAQVPVGGRGKAGGVVRVDSEQELSGVLGRLLGSTIKGRVVRCCRVEEVVEGTECYVAIILDAARGRLRVLLSLAGGVEVEVNASRGAVHSRETSAKVPDVLGAVDDMAAALPGPVAPVLREAARVLAAAFFRYEATLLEINPLFVTRDAQWVAGDAKLVVDDNALARQPAIADLVHERCDDYPELALKLRDGFDFVVLDPDGEIGLVTTGAGLSMQLVDELGELGYRAFNFCDIRTGQFRGNPARLIEVFRRMAAAPTVRSVLINFFAGITHLGELAQVLVAALRAVPELRVPITARLIGNGLDEALAVLDAAGLPLTLKTDLDDAIATAMQAVRR